MTTYGEDKKEYENNSITVYWWNFGKKELDYDGTIKGYLKKAGIYVESIKHPKNQNEKGYRFKIHTSTKIVVLDIFYQTYEEGSLDAIKTYLTLLGDKAKIETNHGTITVNYG